MADSLKDRVSADTKTAMKSGDKQSLSALRLILAAIKQHEVDNRSDVDDDAASELLTRMAKQRRDSIEQYTDGNREDRTSCEQGAEIHAAGVERGGQPDKEHGIVNEPT